MEGKRIAYIDQAKGCGMLLVVFGHAIAWNFGDWEPICVLRPDSTHQQLIGGFLWQLIYAFHMALFFLIAGYLTPTLHDNKVKQYFIRNIKKRTQRLLIPYLISGFLLLLVRDKYGYWFLLSLYELSVVGIIFNIISSTFNRKGRMITDIIIMLLFYYALKKICHLIPIFHSINLGWFILYYIPFFFGILMKRYALIDKLTNIKNIEILSVLFSITFALQYLQMYPLNASLLYHLMELRSYVMPIAGSLLVLTIFRNGVNSNICKLFQLMGRKSMEIYILHVLFVIQIPALGLWILKHNGVTCITLQIVVFTIISVIAITLSLLSSKFIEKMPMCNTLLFGTTLKN